MKYFSINNFINKDLCEKLIQASDIHNFSKNKTLIHGQRQFVSSSDEEFHNLLNNSEEWNNLEKKINSSEFLEFCLKKLDLNDKKFSLVNFFNYKNLTDTQKIYKKISSTKNKLIPTKTLVKYSLLRIYRDLFRKIKFSKIFYPNKSAVELLYDYSKAGNGYSREIHRDSDNRLIVFILYLNAPSKSDNHQGGDFDIYKLINGKKNIAQPEKENCEKIENIKPEAGKLIVFLNESESFHGVEEMKNHSDYRYFIYGSFTLLNQKNPYIKNRSKLATEFHLYD